MTASERQIALATGQPTDEQEQFFIQAVDRPDLVHFFKSLAQPQQMAMARNMARHDAPEMAGLCTRLMVVFDEQVRLALIETLGELAKKKPEVVSKELKNSSSLQRPGVFAALRSLGDSALPHVAARLDEPETRANAAAYLVESGRPAIPFLLKALDSHDAETRRAAAEGLGSLRAFDAAEPLTKLWHEAPAGDKAVYLASLSAVGDRRSEQLFAGVLGNSKQTISDRTVAALGLGRIGTRSSATQLWKYVHDPEEMLAKGALDGLHLAGDAALSDRQRPLSDRILVAHNVQSKLADDTLLEGMTSKMSVIAYTAVDGARGRRALAPKLVAILRGLDAESNGDLVDAIASALVTTDLGRSLAEELAKDSIASAMTRRHLILAGFR